MGEIQGQRRKTRGMNKEEGPEPNKEEQLAAILKGAFSGLPTRLKAIPKRNGKIRAAGRKTRRRQPRKRHAA